MLVERFLLFLPGPVEMEGASRRRVKQVAQSRGYRVWDRGFVAGIPSEPPQESLPGFLVRTFPGTVRSPIAREAVPSGEQACVEWASRRLKFFNVLSLATSRVKLTTDVLGRLRYFRAEVPEGMVISTSILDLLVCFPHLAQPADPLALAEFVGGSSPRENRTVHARIRGSEAGEALVWTPERGPQIEEAPRFEIPEINASISMRTAVEQVRGHLTRSIQECVADPDQLVIPLTGGFDSRLLACIATEEGLSPKAVTLGTRAHLEVRVARAVARTLGIPHRVIPPRFRSLEATDLWMQATEGQVVSGTLYMGQLLNQGFPPGTTVLSGFFGDVLAAGAIHWWRGADFSWDGVAGMIARYNFKKVTSDFTEQLGLACGLDDFAHCIQARLSRAPHPQQAVLLWNLEAPRGIMHQVYYLGQEYHAAVPFYDTELFRTYFSMPSAALENKLLLRSLYRELWPEVAAIPHSEERPTHLPRNWEGAKYLAPWWIQDVGQRLQQRWLPPSRRRPNPTDVWHTWHGVTRAEVAAMIRGVEENRGVVDEVLGWEIPWMHDPPVWQRVGADQGAANGVLEALYFLTVYCRHVRDQMREHPVST